MQNDPIVEETRKIRNRLAAKFKYALKALGAYYQAKQAAENRVVVTRRPKSITTHSKPVASKFEASSTRKNRRVENVRRQQAAAVTLP
ncbi:MAG: hypothetical protein ONB46_09795 [candidate division KSB1 bacterium]|nr:hypothetical protein [candidate division KSB1 bacterium]MDZ7366095.1 hypothetical protein [candidate division KSB1 bacterium]MDZ7404263.1 hypothetical protein [candidate division KSB1 bacterium]